MTPIGILLRDPVFRMLAAAAAAHGAVLACIYPYLSLIAVQNVGLSEPMLALLLGLASIFVAGASVLFGLIADQTGKRRQIALATVGLTVLGCALMLTNPAPLTLFFAHGLLLPIGTQPVRWCALHATLQQPCVRPASRHSTRWRRRELWVQR